MSVTGRAYDFPILKRVFTFVKPYRNTFYLSVFLTILIAFIAPLRPWLIQLTVDDFILEGDADGLLKMTLLMIGLLIVHSLLQYYQTYVTGWLGQVVIKDLRVHLYRHITSFRIKYFDNTPIGTLVTRVISDMETIADIFSEGLIVIIGDILQLAVVIAFMFYTDWRLTLVSLSVMPLLVFAANIFKNGIKKTFNEVRTQVARLNTFVQEHITGMSIVQIFNREEEEMKKFMEINHEHKAANIRSIWYYSIFFPVVEILAAASIGLMIWWGAKGTLEGTVTLGSLFAFILFINMLYRPIRELADKFNTLQMGMVSSERIFRILDTDAHIQNTGTRFPTGLKGEIVFENVWFAYNNEEWVLKNISFKAEVGQTIALVGATGSGKTSIINLLGRLYEYNKGTISIDGVPLRDYELFSLRSRIGMVHQDVFLFSGSIADNITLNNPAITRERVVEAAKNVGADEFINSMPGGYDYPVMERGATLSVGQRQLISFIRAYVYNPSILILDEATSSIDTESERLIQQATEKLTRNRTSIVVAHRLSTIQKADKILVLDHGEIKESGTHQELLKQNGLYRQLYEMQFKTVIQGLT